MGRGLETGAIVVGSVAERLVRRVECPVVVVSGC
jgi:nucleotide-binding universal stress UspA family protein